MIRILSPSLALLGEVDIYDSIIFELKYHEYGTFTIETLLDAQDADKLTIGNLIIVDKDLKKSGIIRARRIQDDGGADKLIVEGDTLGGLMWQRITIPPNGQAFDTQTAEAETLIKHYVQRNAKDLPNMDIPELNVIPSTDKGEVLTWSSRYENLSEELSKISLVSGLGWNILPNFITKKLDFDIYEGKDLTTGQSENERVIFAIEYDNLLNLEVTESVNDYVSEVYVGGAGDGELRTIEVVGDGATGINKHVAFRGAGDDDDLTLIGELELKDKAKVSHFEGEAIDTNLAKYGVNWNLGDIVTVKAKKLGVMVDRRIVEIQEVYQADGHKIIPGFGGSLAGLAEKIKNRITVR